jgi:ketol-acid reductoisomerase
MSFLPEMMANVMIAPKIPRKMVMAVHERGSST